MHGWSPGWRVDAPCGLPGFPVASLQGTLRFTVAGAAAVADLPFGDWSGRIPISSPEAFGLWWGNRANLLCAAGAVCVKGESDKVTQRGDACRCCPRWRAVKAPHPPSRMPPAGVF